MTARILSTTALCALLSQPAFAQDPYDLGTIIVSGGFSPVEAARYGRSASVLTRADIEERGLTTVQQALRALPGLSVSGQGSNFTQVRIRGAEASHTLILIDGIEAAGGDGTYVLSGLETANIERIEVLRGPQSVFYGSNASAGVINIITKRGGEGTEYGGSIEVGGGTTATAFISQRGERGGLSLSLSHADDHGYDFSGDGGERDATRRNTAILSGDYALTDDVKLGFTFRKSNEEYDYDATSWTPTDAASYIVDDPDLYGERDEMTASVFAEYLMLDGRLSHRLSYDWTRNDQSYDGGPFTKTKSEKLAYLLSYSLSGEAVASADQLVNLIVEDETDSSDSNPLYGRGTTSVAVEYRGSFANGFDVQLGARRDFNDSFDDITTWNAAMSYGFDNGVRLHASAGTGSVNPSYFELYADAFGYTGNPNLMPETNQSFDVGIELPIFGDRGVVDVTYFNERLSDEITDISTGPGTFSFENQVGKSTREGLEVGGQVAATDTLDLRFGYTWLDAKNPDGSVETRRPEHELTLGATLAAFGGRGSISADLRHVAGNYDTQYWGAFETVEMPAFTTVDVAARYALTDEVTLTGRVENLFDVDASESWGYAARPMTAYVGLEARF
ncbi:TonB-dependent receptor [Aliiroseovarius sediminis]|uniref:TonB-dependent receptor plug domain-containing protein n=1 Tax=Aliiroseovarius sediminis TaxID=2925839 RepID=UPI001F57A6ED|nr:TonB-dependent receptor [Aliiroseovarius sediminis]MCI2393815.1 TonB-dependent receptor [Aliiroseovarius sediminis]